MKKITFLTLVFMLIIPISSYGTDGQIKIGQTPSTTFPITISQSGSYVLTSNLSVTDPNVNAIEITVNDVTLDLNGHMIQGPHTGPPWGGTKNGIYAFDRYNITIKNGRVWGFGNHGVYFENYSPTAEGAGHQIKNIQAANNGVIGIVIHAGMITDSTANNNGSYGIWANNSTVRNCTANNNLNDGFVGFNCTVTNCTANENGNLGIYFQNSTITNCVANSNQTGFLVSCCTITNCTAYYNAASGIGAFSRNRIEGNNLVENGQGGGSDGYGLDIADGTFSNYVIKNTASGNISGGFRTPGGVINYVPICGVGDPTDNCNYDF